jgi:hypothetical protein
MGNRWATVTITDGEGRRHSVEVYVASTCDAAHLFAAHAKADPRNGLPELGLDTVFEVVVNGRIHHVQRAALQRWIVKERHERKGPAGLLFSQRPTLE